MVKTSFTVIPSYKIIKANYSLEIYFLFPDDTTGCLYVHFKDKT